MNDPEKLRDLARRYQEAYPDAFTPEDVIAWAIAEGHMPPLAGMARAMAVEELDEALDGAKMRLDDGREVSEYLTLDPPPVDADPAFRALTEKPESKWTLEDYKTHLRGRYEYAIRECTRSIDDVEHMLQLHPDWGSAWVQAKLASFRASREEAKQGLAKLAGREPLHKPKGEL